MYYLTGKIKDLLIRKELKGDVDIKKKILKENKGTLTTENEILVTPDGGYFSQGKLIYDEGESISELEDDLLKETAKLIFKKYTLINTSYTISKKSTLEKALEKADKIITEYSIYIKEMIFQHNITGLWLSEKFRISRDEALYIIKKLTFEKILIKTYSYWTMPAKIKKELKIKLNAVKPYEPKKDTWLEESKKEINEAIIEDKEIKNKKLYKNA